MGIIDHARNFRPPEHDEPTIDHGRNWREEDMKENIEGFMKVAGDALRHMISPAPDETLDLLNLTESQIERLNKAMGVKPKVWTPPPTPFLAVDMAIILESDHDRKGDLDRILLIKRKFPPLGYAMPGGFVDVGEECEFAAEREVIEETNLHVKNPRLFGVYSRPDRDPRAHIVSVLYMYKDILNVNKMKAGDDAAGAEWVLISSIPEMIKRGMIASKGHVEMLEDIIRRGWL